MRKIRPDMSLLEALIVLADGNPGAAVALGRVLQEGLKRHEEIKILVSIIMLDEGGICGPKIWLLYKDVYGRNIGKFYKALLNQQIKIDTNKKCQEDARFRENWMGSWRTDGCVIAGRDVPLLGLELKGSILEKKKKKDEKEERNIGKM